MPEYRIRNITLRIPQAQLSPPLARALESGGYEAAEAGALLRHLRPGDRVLDLGAGAGYLSAIAATVVGGAQVTAVEAAPAMLPVLRRNLNLNGAGEARVIHGAAVADDVEETELPFQIARAFWASRLAGEEGEGAEALRVPALKLGDLARELRPSVVVMDIEGGEVALCQQAWPDCVRLLILEIHPELYGPDRIKAIFDGLSRAGFTYMPWGSRGKVVVQQRLAGTPPPPPTLQAPPKP